MAMVECEHGNIPGHCSTCDKQLLIDCVNPWLKKQYADALNAVQTLKLAGPAQTAPYRAMTLAHIQAIDTLNRKKRALWEHLCNLHNIPPGD